MEHTVYKKLARKLDDIPNGFPATESGIELKLLAKIFTPEEAAIASVMRLSREPAADIAARLDLDPKETYRSLKQMARKGQIRASRGKGEITFGLMPFVVGIYEEQLPRMDAELAELTEAYFQETRGGITKAIPSVHRVIPVEESIPVDLEIFPFEKASAMIKNAKSWGVRDCICRVQQHLVGKGCERPVESCLVFAPVEGYFDHSEVDRAITKQEALKILQETEEAGLVHSTGNYRDHTHYICNCCTCCCGILRGVAEFGIPTAVARSDFRAVVESEICMGCEDCQEWCQFGALSIDGGVCLVSETHCVGCGLCVQACNTGALTMKRLPKDETTQPPADLRSWMMVRAEKRRLSMGDIL